MAALKKQSKKKVTKQNGFTREALDEEVEVAIVGGGFSGLLAGARLRDAGAKR